MSPSCIHEDAGLIPGLTQQVKDTEFLWSLCRLQQQPRSHIAMAVVLSSDSTPSLGTSIYIGYSPKKQKKKKKERTRLTQRKLFCGKIYINSSELKFQNVKNFRNTYTNLLHLYFPFFICMGWIYNPKFCINKFRIYIIKLKVLTDKKCSNLINKIFS